MNWLKKHEWIIAAVMIGGLLVLFPMIGSLFSDRVVTAVIVTESSYEDSYDLLCVLSDDYQAERTPQAKSQTYRKGESIRITIKKSRYDAEMYDCGDKVKIYFNGKVENRALPSLTANKMEIEKKKEEIDSYFPEIYGSSKLQEQKKTAAAIIRDGYGSVNKEQIRSFIDSVKNSTLASLEIFHEEGDEKGVPRLTYLLYDGERLHALIDSETGRASIRGYKYCSFIETGETQSFYVSNDRDDRDKAALIFKVSNSNTYR